MEYACLTALKAIHDQYFVKINIKNNISCNSFFYFGFVYQWSTFLIEKHAIVSPQQVAFDILNILIIISSFSSYFTLLIVYIDLIMFALFLYLPVTFRYHSLNS